MRILVGIYDSLTTVEQVVNDLKDAGFKQNDMHMATHDPRAQERGAGGFFESLRNTFGREPHKVGDDRQDLMQQLQGWGIPAEDAGQYAEAVRRGNTLLMVNSPDDQVTQAKQIMDNYDPVNIEQVAGQWQQEGWKGYDTKAAPFSDDQIAEERRRTTAKLADEDMTARREGETRIPIVEEQMNVDKRRVQGGGVRVHTDVVEQPFEQEVNLRDERVHVDRRDVDRPATEADLNAAFKEQEIEVNEMHEEVQANKEARVTGEVIVSKSAEEHPETVRETLRRTEVHTEDLRGQARNLQSEYNTFDSDFHNHYDLAYANSGHNYSYYEPGYRYGYDLAGNDRYTGRRWSEIEPDARREWQRTHPNSAWDDFKDSIRHGWERVTAAASGRGTSTSTGFVPDERYDTGTSTDTGLYNTGDERP